MNLLWYSCGRIGGNLVKYSEPFGMKINVYDPYIEIPFNSRVNVCEELEILFKNLILLLSAST